MRSVNIKRIFLCTDLRAGENSLGKIAEAQGFKRQELGRYEVLMFFNRKRNKMRVIAKKGMYSESLDARQTYDFSLRREQILATVGQFLGLEFNVSDKVFNIARREAGIDKEFKQSAA